MELVLKLLGIPSTSLRMVRRMVSLSNHLFGVLARTLVPYLRKLKQGKVKKFWKGYWIQAYAYIEHYMMDAWSSVDIEDPTPLTLAQVLGYQKYKDKSFSFTDVTSFVIMKDLNIKKAFAFDREFIQAGIELIE